MEDENSYFFDPVTSTTIDLVIERNGVKVGHYSNETTESLKTRYPGLIIIGETDAVQRQRAKYIKAPTVTDADRFGEALDCLPPSRWTTRTSSESFHICERISHDIVSWFVRIGRDYYQFDDTCYLTHEQAVEKVLDWLKKDAATKGVPTPAEAVPA